MKLVNIRLLVSDFPASLSFWRDIMKLPLSFSDETMGYAYFDTGSAGIELMSRAGFAAALGEMRPSFLTEGNPAVIVFRVDNVDATYHELVERGAKALVEPVDRPLWQARTAHLSDPDGYLVEIYSQIQTEPSSTT